MIKQHPTSDLLAEYAAGCLPWAQAICVTTHLHYCKECRAELEKLNELGAQLMDEQPKVEVGGSVLDQVLNRIDQPQTVMPVEKPAPVVSSSSRADLPPVVGQLIDTTGIHWQKISSGLKAARLKSGDENHEVALHKISAGAKVAHHDHRATEITVVLRGSFSDEDGVYAVGDFLLREPGEAHRPMAAQNEDCLCLSAQQAPIRLTGAWRWFNPFLKIQPG
ncbi:ChrR family anti-sigma-E factor [Aestuariirhabdus sp. Z084]|uniref:ChrR family anti-sigma-E factor n=1 Tax=Aestuariirhabdus haliotis TaxID=2918751 RepID=UPI00201B4451|nr:ChrR family anti-sigma-E factor [Aestuariirhabdus haliotis]MCL6416044.1 ChrR family anti-sigma-E factor [Aestuariirhabdus haliotis]MCL6419388.1 ChrR family anti-sigma-E factor [Aestuariirhabdus haliotis]